MSDRRAPHRRRTPRSSARRCAVLVAGAAVVLAGTATGAAHAAPAQPTKSTLALHVPAQMTGEVYDEGNGRSSTYVDSTLFLEALGPKFELWSHRADYSSPVTTTMYRGDQAVRLPAGTTSTLAGLSDFLDVSVRNAAGREVYRRSNTVCLNDYQPVRAQPNGAAHSAYPAACADNPFALGSVQGIAKGWASHISPFGNGYGFYRGGDELHLPAGTYTVDASIAPKYRSLFGIADADAGGTSTLTITQYDDGGGVGAAPAHHDAQASSGASSGASSASAATAPQGRALAASPKSGPRPDLAALPAWGISVSHGKNLAFGATVWNAGTSPLVVNGYRQGTSDTMDAYQYFYDANGHETGYVRAGSMEWDPRASHNHWHFEDFARYTLLDADMKTAVVSEKEAFCLANTDAIDYTLPAANWHPDNTDLQTACGDHSSVAVSEVLAAGSGDTYSQYRAGQAFRLDGLKNGIYYIAVEANPAGTLSELTTANNTALRKVSIGGTPGHRTVHVFPVGTVTE